MDALEKRDIVRETVAGIAGIAIFLVCDRALSMPHWGDYANGIVFATAVAVVFYVGLHLAWPTRPGWLELRLGLDRSIRLTVVDNNPDSLRAALNHTVAMTRPRVSPPVAAALDRVAEAAESVLEIWTDSDAGREAAYTLHATITQYLPDTIERYLDLPKRFAREREIRDGKTARDLVQEQFDVLTRELSAMADKLNQGRAAELSAQGRFLNQRFTQDDPLA